MTTAATHSGLINQMDLFLPYLADMPLRDQREVMERPFFSLAKSRRLKPIDYRSPDGKIWVHVSANPSYGMATIWDADILIYCASVISDMKRRGVNNIPRTLQVMPYDILRSIGRQTTGRAYELLTQSLDRLQSTTVKTNIRAENRRETTFSWLDSWTQLVDERTERSRGMSLTLADWFYEGLLMDGGVLAIDRAYFDISGGRERWLYKVARKHAGGAGEGGFAISLPTLFEKSGAEGLYRRFKFEMAAIARSDNLPGYRLVWEEGKARGEPSMRMIKRDPTPDYPARPSTEPVLGLAFGKTRGLGAVGSERSKAQIGRPLSERTLDQLRRDCAGWDFYALQSEFDGWLQGDPSRLPANYEAAFVGFVRRYHDKNRHTLNHY
jgi:plasmid replication initiation protein